MPELAAHLERVARELVQQLDDEQLVYWCTESGLPIGSIDPARERAIQIVAAALAACAREARLQEANAAYWSWKLSHEDFGANQQKRLDELRKEG